MKVQNFNDLIAEMRAVARGEKPAPADAGGVSVESSEVLVRLLTPENRHLLDMIETRHPQSIAELEGMSGRKGPNLLRTLNKLEAVGLIRMQQVKRRKVPTVITRQILIKIDPCREEDEIAFA